YDRCTSCHLGVERANFDKDSLRALKDVPAESSAKLKAAFKLLKDREERKEKLGFDPDDLPNVPDWPVGLVSLLLVIIAFGGAAGLGYFTRSGSMGFAVLLVGLIVALVGNRVMASLSPRTAVMEPVALDNPEVTQYCAHPRLDLFVDANSPHPV